MYGQRDKLGDVNRFINRWRVEKKDRIDRQTDRGKADKYRLCVDRERSHLDRSIGVDREIDR